MRAALSAAELEARLAAEFPEAFHADSGLAILEAGHRAARVRLTPPANAVRQGGTISVTANILLFPKFAIFIAPKRLSAQCRITFLGDSTGAFLPS